MTDHLEWPQRWVTAQDSAEATAALTLLALNGMHPEQIAQLTDAHIDLDRAWITTADGLTLPLVAQSVAALRQVDDYEAIAAHTDALHPIADDAQRRLAGALWITDDENQLVFDVISDGESVILPLAVTFPFSIADRLHPDDDSSVAARSRIVLQRAADWLSQEASATPSLIERALTVLREGSLVFVFASTGVSGLNLIHNVLMGRLLSPADYSQLTFVITLQLLIGLLPTAMQTVVARFSARYAAQDDFARFDLLRKRMRRVGWLAGFVILAVLAVLTPFFVEWFQLDGVNVLLPMLLAVPFFIATGPDRGLLQGLNRYFWLSGAYVAEGVIRLGVGVALGYALLSSGRALDGAIWGLAQSMLATWLIAWVALRTLKPVDPQAVAQAADAQEGRAWWALARITLFALVGQALITNSDFLLVKNFFTPDEAGLYAAVSVLGRIVYFGALPLTVLLVPLVARRQALGQATRPILLLLIGGGVTVCGALILVASVAGSQVLGLLYGPEYVSAAPLLAPYALAASLYTLTNLVITYQIALGKGGETWMPLLAGTAQIIAVLLFHESLTQVITIQIILMGALFAVVLWRVLFAADAYSTPRLAEVPG